MLIEGDIVAAENATPEHATTAHDDEIANAAPKGEPMFTGLVETVGRVRVPSNAARQLGALHRAPALCKSVRIGDSIATNGVCLTATRVDDVGFCADVMHETLRRSSLGR